jgi:hypothetical protein
MGTRTLVLVFSSLPFLAGARADLQLTPRESHYVLEGMKLDQLAFSDGSGKEVTYQQPPGWKYSGGADKLTLYPPAKGLAEGAIVRINLAKPGTFDQDSLKKLIQDALTSPPGGSTDITLVSQQMNPIKIGGKETFLAILAYTLNGVKYERSLLFLNRGKEQVRFQLTSRAVDFADLQKSFLASQCTWQHL